MAAIQIDGWKCEQCEHVWLAQAGKVPTHCASSKCRSRKWNESKQSHNAPSVSCDHATSVIPVAAIASEDNNTPEDVRDLEIVYDDF